jgi:hypothetical protein
MERASGDERPKRLFAGRRGIAPTNLLAEALTRAESCRRSQEATGNTPRSKWRDNPMNQIHTLATPTPGARLKPFNKN